MATFIGTNGNDTIAPGSVSAGVIRSPAGSFPSVAADVLSGGFGDDSLSGGLGGDTLLGGNGNDTIVVNVGTSQADGEAGDDRFVASGLLGPATTISGGADTDTLAQNGVVDISSATITGIERLALTGATLTLTATQLSGFSQVTGDGAATIGALVLSGAGAATVNVTGLTALSVAGTSGIDALTFVTPGPVVPNLTVNLGQGNDGVVGGGGNDTLRGEDGNDFISGGLGADSVSGGAGNDSIELAAGDRIEGNGGDDTFTIFGDIAAPTQIDGGTGIDTLRAFAVTTISPDTQINGVENLALDAQPFTLSVKTLDGFTTIVSDNGATSGLLALTDDGFDTTFASTAVTQLANLAVTGTGVDDTLIFTTPGPTLTDIALDGGAGDDSLQTGGGSDLLTGGLGNDTLDGGAGADSLDGGDGNDVLRVRNLDTVSGGEGDDRFELLEDLTGLAALDGGAGNDTLAASGARTIAGSVTFDFIDFLALDSAPLTLSTNQFSSFDGLTADNGATAGAVRLTAGGAAFLFVDASLLDLSIDGSAGGESLVFVAGTGTSLTITARDGNDSLRGGDGDDSLNGGVGSDTVVGGAGADVLDGDVGNDLMGIGGGDTVLGGSGNDVFNYDVVLTGAEKLDGGSGLDSLDFNGAFVIGANVSINAIEQLALDGGGVTLSATQLGTFATIVSDGSGTASIVTLSAGGTATLGVTGITSLLVAGSVDADLLTFNTTVAAINAALGAGNDSLQSGSLADSLNGGVGNDSLSGLAGNDSLIGGSGVDLLQGGAGADTLGGGTETDTLIGGAGADRLTGGGAADFFRFDLPTEGVDTVTDYSSALGDKIQISASGFGGGLVAGQPLAAGLLNVTNSYIANSPTGTAQFVYNTATQVLVWDADGSGGANPVGLARLTGVATLTTADFVIVA